jgi:hypothetical protein
MNDELQLESILNTSDQMFAQMVRIALEEKEIKVFVQNENFASAMPHYAILSGFDIQVPAADATRAREIIGRVRPGVEKSAAACPTCNSTNVGLSGLMHRFGLLVAVSLIVMQFFPPLRRRYKCRDCGNTWTMPRQ